MSLNLDLQQFELIDDAVALLEPAKLEVDHANSVFWKWTGLEPGKCLLEAIFKSVDQQKLKSDLSTKAEFAFETETTPKEGRKLPVEYTMRKMELLGKPVVILHGRNIAKVKEKEMMLKSFTSIIEVNNRKLSNQKKQIQDLLDNMQQAVFAVKADGSIVEPVSKYSAKLFGGAISGQTIFDTLYRSIDRKSELYSLIKTAVTSVFGESDLQWDLSAEHFPKRVVYLAPESDALPEEEKAQKQRTFKVLTGPIWNDEGLLERLLFVVEDLTEIERLEKQVAREKEANTKNIQIIQELAELDKQAAEGFFNSSVKLIQDSMILTQEMKMDPEKVLELFRRIHTLKGNSRIFKLSLIATVTHRVENDIVAARECFEKKAPIPVELIDVIAKGLEQIRIQLQEYNKFGKQIFGIEDEFQTAIVADIHKMVTVLDSSLAPLLGEASLAATKNVDAAEQRRIMHSLKGTARLLHSLKGAARLSHTIKGTGKSSGSDSLADISSHLEHGLELLKTPEKISFDDMKKDLLLPLEALKQTSAKLFLDSTLSPPLAGEKEVWTPVFVGAFQLSHALLDNDAHKQSTQKFIEIAHNLSAHCAANRFDYLAHLFSLIEALVVSMEQDATALKEAFLVLGQAWKFLALVSFLELDQKASNEVRKALSDDLGSPAKKESSQMVAATIDSILLASAIQVAKDVGSKSIFIDVVARIWGVNASEVLDRFIGALHRPMSALVGVEQILVRSAHDADIFQQLDELAKDGEHVADAIEFVFEGGQDESRLKMSRYLRKIEVLRLIRGFKTEGDSLDKSTMPKMIPIIEANYVSLSEIARQPSFEPATVKDAIQRLMEIPAGMMVSRFNSMVTDIARSLSKNVYFRIKGQSVKVDRERLSQLQDALLHMIRNSLDHGIESRQERLDAKKSETAMLEVKFENQKNGDLTVIVSDDGRGIDVERLVQKAVSKNLIAADKAAKLSREEKLDLIFLPGLSTAENVTQLSGRGVGMDVVKTTVEKLQGKISIKSEIKKGTEIAIQLVRA